MPIVALDPSHAAALQRFLQDFDAAEEMVIPAYFASRSWSHNQVLRSLEEAKIGDSAKGRVPTTTRFYVEEGEVLGLFNFRHHLNDALERYGGHVGYSVGPRHRGRGVATQLLQAARSLARSHGLQRLVLTCDPTNIASIRVIEKNGGRLQDTFYHEGARREVSRFDLPT
jgi:predicted acetyltransferase